MNTIVTILVKILVHYINDSKWIVVWLRVIKLVGENNHNKRNQGHKGQSSFHRVHLTHGVHVVITCFQYISDSKEMGNNNKPSI